MGRAIKMHHVRPLFQGLPVPGKYYAYYEDDNTHGAYGNTRGEALANLIRQSTPVTIDSIDLSTGPFGE